MKKSFMTRVLAVSLSAAMAFSVSSASNLMTASAASTVNLKTTFKTLKVNQTYKMTLKNNTLNWKITKVQTTDKKICTVYGKTSSYVMLKGKGVGRAKITVTVKTTKRKKNNVKKMKCTANVKAAEEAFSASAVANSNTEVKVNFTQAVDAAAAENFTVSDGVTVSEAKLSDDKKSVVLTVAGAEYGKSYDLTVTGIKVAGKAQADQKLTFTTPAATDKYPMTLEAKDPILKSDSSSQTLVTFTIKDENGNLIKDKGVEVAFATSLGKFAEQRVSIQDGVATNMYTAETLMQTQTAQITATIVESTENKELLGLNTTTSITLTPNPEAFGDTSIGAIITSATAPTADRIIAYFNKDVKADDFKTKSGKMDTSKFSCTVQSGLDNGFAVVEGITQEHSIVGILPVEGESKALQLLVNKPMVDNTNVGVEFENKTESDSLVSAKNKVYFKLTDARQPAVLSASGNGLREITINFSEAVLPTNYCDGWDPKKDNIDTAQAFFAADNWKNYLIDGQPLDWWGVSAVTASPDGEEEDSISTTPKKESSKNPGISSNTADDMDGTIRVGSYKEGKDNRHVVTIKVGRKHYLTPGTHRLSVSNVGDWAAKTDRERNIVNTQGFDFEVVGNDVVPTFEVTPQSPEQYLLTFNSEVEPVVSGETFTTPGSDDFATILKLQQRSGGSWVDISDGNTNGKNPITVSKVKDNQYIVEVRKDWTEVYDTTSTRENYFNHELRLHLDAGKVVNLANNKQNTEINVPLTGEIMTTPDVVSPVIGEVVPAVDKNGNTLESYNVTMSEPVKVSGTANSVEGLTPSQTQKAGITAASEQNQGVPVPSAQFIRVDNGQTVEGRIADYFIDAADTTINVEPETTLSAGEWRLVLSSISDDYGNTAATVAQTINVVREAATSDFKIVWAAVSNQEEYNVKNIGVNRGRYIFVKFNKPVTMTGNSTNAQVTANYTINGSTLPTGTQIKAKITGYDDHVRNVTDSVTIILPEGNFSGNNYFDVDGKNAMLNVSKAITSTTGATLANGGMIRMPFQFGESTQTNTGNDTSKIESLQPKTDAVWGNHADEMHKVAGGSLDDKEYYQKLKAALENDQYRKVILTKDLNLNDEEAKVVSAFGRSHTLTINRAVNLDLNGHTIYGNVVVSTNDIADLMSISSSSTAAKITGYTLNRAKVPTLKVTAGNIEEFKITGVTVTSAGDSNVAIDLNDVFENTFVNEGTVKGDVQITDTNKAGFMFGDAVGTIDGNLNINTKGEVKLKGIINDDKLTGDITVSQPAVLKIADTATIDGKEIWVDAKDTRVIIDKAAKLLNSPSIHATAEVRVTIPANQVANISCVAEMGGSFKAVDSSNNEVPAGGKDGIAGEVNPSSSKVKAVVDHLNVITGEVVADNATPPTSISQGALSGGSINVTEVANVIKTAIINANTEDNDGVEETFKVTVDYTLLSTNLVEKKTEDGGATTKYVLKDKNGNGKGNDRVKVVLTLVKDGRTTTVTKYFDITEK